MALTHQLTGLSLLVISCQLTVMLFSSWAVYLIFSVAVMVAIYLSSINIKSRFLRFGLMAFAFFPFRCFFKPYVMPVWILIIIFLYVSRAKHHPTLPPHRLWEPWFGTLRALIRNKDRFLDYIIESREKQKYSYFTSGPFQPGVTVIVPPNPEFVKYILKDNWQNYIIAPSRVDVLHDFLGEGIFSTNGQPWRFQRKSASHMVAEKHLKGMMTESFQRHNIMLQRVLEDHSKIGSPLDMQDIFFRFTMDSFMEIAFGKTINSLSEAKKPKFAQAFDGVQREIMMRMFTPKPIWKLMRLLNIGFEAKIKQHMKIINDEVKQIIKSREKNLQKKKSNNADTNEEAKDLISLFIKQSIKNKKNKKNDSTIIDEEFIRNIIVNFLVAGRDTTAGALSWFFYEMAMNPDIEEKVIHEVDSLINNKYHISYQDAQKLKYTEAAFLETLRLHPSVPLESRLAIKNDKLPSGEIVYKNNLVVYDPYTWGRSSNIWLNPSTFDPNRWLKDSANRPTDWMYPTFNAGPRKCLGKSIALLEAKMVISNILSRYKLRIMKGFKVKQKIAITLVMENGIQMNVISRGR